jgi:phage repressor protein C with HTH and peptisase S24 domain
MTDDELKSLIARRLRVVAAEEYGGNQTQMARDIGLGQSKVSRVLREELKSADPYLDVAHAVAATLDYSVEQITDPDSGDPGLLPSVRETGQIRMAPSVLGSSAGKTNMDDWNFGSFALDNRLLEMANRGKVAAPDEVFVMKVNGEAMYPYLPPGSFVVWTEQDDISDGAVHLLSFDGRIVAREASLLPGRRLHLHAFKESVPDQTIRKTRSGSWVTSSTDQEYPVEFSVLGMMVGRLQLDAPQHQGEDVRRLIDYIQDGNRTNGHVAGDRENNPRAP